MTRSVAITRGLRYGAPLALFALAFVVRAAAWREVLLPARVVPIGADAFYHLRRIAVSVFRHPAFLGFDPYLHFPDGAKPIWTPLFDRWIASALRPFVAGDVDTGLLALERLVVWVPPVLGSLSVVAAFGLTRRHFGLASGLLAGVVLAILSGHYWYSQIGFVDHHAAVALAATLLLGAAMTLVGRPQRAAHGWLAAILVGVLAAGSLLLWPGSLLHVGLVEIGLLAVLFSRPALASARDLAAKLAAGYAVGFALVAPAGFSSDWPQWGAYSPVVLSRFQPWLFAVGALATGLCWLLWRSPQLGAERGRRGLVFAALCVLGSGLSVLAFPEIVDGLRDAIRWAGKGEAFQSHVAESTPLFFEGGRFTVRIAIVRLSPFVFAFPVAALWLAWRHRERATIAPLGLLLLFSVGLLAMTLVQKRFFNSASIGLAIVFALVTKELWTLAGSRTRRVALGATAALALLPTLEPYARPLGNELRVLRGEPVALGGRFAASRTMLEVADWLREHTEPTSGWLENGPPPEYGVLAPWPLGHAIVYVGRRPTVVGNFGDDLGPEAFRFADEAFRKPESEALAGLEARRVRYVVAQRSPGFLSAPPARHGLLRAMHADDGGGSPGGEDTRAAPALQHHRLVFESRGLRWSEPDAEAYYKVFERVTGAVIVGRAAAGAQIDVRLGAFTNRGRKILYSRRVVADASGEYRLRVPYATGASDGLRTAPLYRLECRGEVRGVGVEEAAVREGRTVRAPSLCLGAPTRP